MYENKKYILEYGLLTFGFILSLLNQPRKLVSLCASPQRWDYPAYFPMTCVMLKVIAL